MILLSATLSENNWSGWIILALMLPGLIVIVAIVIAFLFRRPNKGDITSVPTPGYYRVLGIDRQTGAKRESMFHADSRQSAEGRADLEGIVVMEIQQVNESLPEG